MPTCADCYFNVGVSEQQLKNSEAAEAAFKKAIELRPNYPEAYNALAVLYTPDKKMDLGGGSLGEGGRAQHRLGRRQQRRFALQRRRRPLEREQVPEAGSTFEAAIKADRIMRIRTSCSGR